MGSVDENGGASELQSHWPLGPLVLLQMCAAFCFASYAKASATASVVVVARIRPKLPKEDKEPDG